MSQVDEGGDEKSPLMGGRTPLIKNEDMFRMENGMYTANRKPELSAEQVHDDTCRRGTQLKNISG